MAQASKKKAPKKGTARSKSAPNSVYSIADLAAQVESEFDPQAKKSGNGSSSAPKRQTKRVSFEDLDPIDRQIPFNRQFLRLKQVESGVDDKGAGLMGKLGSNMKGLISGFRGKEMEREEVIQLRKTIGTLKETKVSAGSAPTPPPVSTVDDPGGPKTKSQLLDEKRKKIQAKSKGDKKDRKDKNIIGLRNELEKLKKKFPADYNLIILDAILTTRDGCLIHRTTEERVTTLTSALRDAASVTSKNYLTTFSVDVVFDIYFLYLEALKKLFVDRFKKISTASVRQDPVTVESARRDIRIINVLLEQKKLKKTVFNVAQKLNGFGYPYISMTPMDVAKSFGASDGNENEKIGPGTVKLNKFLIRIYLNVFAQIPMLQPVAQKICDALPDDHTCRVLIANVNLDNGYTQLKISKAAKDPAVLKQTLALFNYGKQFIKSIMKDSPNSAAEGRILLRAAEMAEEYGFVANKVEPDIIKHGYQFATLALPFYKDEAESIIRRLFEIGDLKKIDLREPVS